MNAKATTVQLTIQVPEDIAAAIDAFIANASSSLIDDINAATMSESGNPHKNPRQQFLAWAIRKCLTINAPSRVFGAKIDQDVQEIMDRNTAIYQENPDAWYDLTAIGSTMLRDLGHNPNSVKRWIELNADRLAEHHASVGIVDAVNHNRRAGKARKLV